MRGKKGRRGVKRIAFAFYNPPSSVEDWYIFPLEIYIHKTQTLNVTYKNISVSKPLIVLIFNVLPRDMFFSGYRYCDRRAIFNRHNGEMTVNLNCS